MRKLRHLQMFYEKSEESRPPLKLNWYLLTFFSKMLQLESLLHKITLWLTCPPKGWNGLQPHWDLQFICNIMFKLKLVHTIFTWLSNEGIPIKMFSIPGQHDFGLFKEIENTPDIFDNIEPSICIQQLSNIVSKHLS